MAGPRIGIAVAALALAWAAAGACAGREATLGSAAAAEGRYFGAALDPDAFDEKSYRDLAASQLTSVTPENAMKWGPIEPRRGAFEWRGADALVAFARANGQRIRGHALVWHSQLPSRLVNGGFSPEELRDLDGRPHRRRGRPLQGRDLCLGRRQRALRRRRLVAAVDLVRRDADYVAIALKAAREADPDAKLYINDYNVETDGPKMRALYDLVAALKRQGAPIDGVGLQSHFVVGRARPDFQAVMQEFAALGVDVAVTELDVRIPLPAGGAALARQAEDYAMVAGACRATPRCVGVTTWGLTDDHSWIPSFFSGYGAALPFDENYRPKPAVAAMIRALTEPKQ